MLRGACGRVCLSLRADAHDTPGHLRTRRPAGPAVVTAVAPRVDQWLVSWNPHVAAARVNSGDCMSIVAGNTRITPSRSLITPARPASGLDGIVVLGSGNW